MHLFVTAALLVLGFPSIMTEVVKSFSKCNSFFLKEELPFIKDVLEHSTLLDSNRYKLICQKYEDKYRFATLYDRIAKIPLFSAYKFTAVYGKTPHIPWMIEPQLYPSDGSMCEPGENQAVDGDYRDQNTLNRGHLFPNGHAPDENTAESTYTLTNTVPQNIKLNSGSWRKMEQKVRSFMKTNCRDENNAANILAYVLTGAVPGKTLLNERVNIPSHMWTAFCCFNTKTEAWVSQAHWAVNKDEKDPIPEKTLEQLEGFLGSKFKQSSLFNEICYSYVKDDQPRRLILHHFLHEYIPGYVAKRSLK